MCIYAAACWGVMYLYSADNSTFHRILLANPLY